MNSSENNSNFKNYIYFWVGQLSSLLGSIVVQFVIIWWITIETESILILALSSFLYFLPQVIFTPIAGVLIDSWDRKKIIIIVDTSQAFLTLLIIILNTLLSGLLGVVIIISINTARGIFQAFHYPAINAVIPTMVPKDKLSRINGLNSTLNQVLQIIGPSLASFLIVMFPIHEVLYIEILTLGIALISLAKIKIPSTKCKISQKKLTFRESFIQGFRLIKKMPKILTMIMLFMCLNFLLQPISVLFSYFVNVTHQGSVSDYAFIMTLFHTGFLFGGILMSVKKKWKNEIKTIFLSIFFVLFSYILLSMSPKSFYLYIGLVFALMGFNLPITNSLFQTLLQTNVPKEIFGRVFSIYITFSWLITPMGKITIGILGELFSIEYLFLSCAFIGIGTLLIFYGIIYFFQKEDLALIITESPVNP